MGRTTHIYKKDYNIFTSIAIKEIWYKSFGFTFDRLVFENEIDIQEFYDNYGYGEIPNGAFIISRENLITILDIAKSKDRDINDNTHDYGSVANELTDLLNNSSDTEYYFKHSD